MTAKAKAAPAEMTPMDRFRAESAALSHTLDELDHIQRETWQRESKLAQEAIQALRADLALATAEAKAEGDASREELEKALTDVVDAWRGRVDELRLQGHLAEMEAHDAVERLRHDAPRSVTDLRAAAQQALGALRSAWTRARRAAPVA